MIARELLEYIDIRDGLLAMVEHSANHENVSRLEFVNIIVSERLLTAIGFGPGELDQEKEICALVARRIADRRGSINNNIERKQLAA